MKTTCENYTTFFKISQQTSNSGMKLNKLPYKLTPEQIKTKTINQAKNTIKNLIMTNYDKDFKRVDFTFKPEYFTLDKKVCYERIQEALEKLSDYISKMKRYKNFGEIKCFATTEVNEKNNTRHIHSVIRMPFLPNKELLQKFIWKYGFISIRAMSKKQNLKEVDKSIDYATKYVSKDWEDEKQNSEENEPLYFITRNWVRPESKSIKLSKRDFELFKSKIKRACERNENITYEQKSIRFEYGLVKEFYTVYVKGDWFENLEGLIPDYLIPEPDIVVS